MEEGWEEEEGEGLVGGGGAGGGGGGAEGLRVLAVQLRFGGHLNYWQVRMLTHADVC